jgi:choice-of-anchor C domain-containing protein
MRTLIRALVFALPALSAVPASAAPILVNGSFEIGPPMGGFQDVDVLAGSSAISGWTVFGTSIDYLGTPWDVPAGQHAIDLDGRESIFSGVSQTFATDIGQLYQVSFSLSGNPGGGPIVKEMLAMVGPYSAAYSFDTSGQTIDALMWTPISFTFTANTAFSTLSFVSLTGTPNSYGALIDNATVQRVPEPATLMLIGVGIGFVVVARDARKMKAWSPKCSQCFVSARRIASSPITR